MTIHTFASTGEAYDRSQFDDAIEDGDILIVPSEGVAGWLEQAWPIAATPSIGQFHRLADTAWLLAENPDRGQDHVATKVREATAALIAAREAALEDEAWDRNAELDRRAA
ncbi:hypothetical protein [Nocardia testacea]|uniref:hypothetical protein n=1 Tax=Nocardia testacea TaxID=248551 RepID=UPI000317AC3D|nr:hypothetical protein [Nocardia testacea]